MAIPFRARGDLEIGWSGEAACPPGADGKTCSSSSTVTLSRPGIPLEHIQGQLERVKGESNGVTFEVDGTLNSGA